MIELSETPPAAMVRSAEVRPLLDTVSFDHYKFSVSLLATLSPRVALLGSDFWDMDSAFCR